MTPGTQASPSQAAAPMAAGVRLQAMRRRVRLTRVAAWTVIAAGPVALCVALTSHPTTVGAAAAAQPTVVRTAAARAADPGGYAQLFVGAWLRSSADDVTSAQARLAQSMAPNVDLPQPATDAQSTPEAVTTLRSAQTGSGAWVVTVAAQYADGWVRYYTVPVTADRTGASFTVTGAPGVVAGPARAAETTSPYTVIVPEGELSSAVGEFLAACLTGAGEVDRYLAPGVHLSAVSPRPGGLSFLDASSSGTSATAGSWPTSRATCPQPCRRTEHRLRTGLTDRDVVQRALARILWSGRGGLPRHSNSAVCPFVRPRALSRLSTVADAPSCWCGVPRSATGYGCAGAAFLESAA